MRPQQKRLFDYGIMGGLMLLLMACGRTRTLVVLLPGEPEAPGAVAVGEGSQAALLDTPLSAARVDTRGRARQAVLTREEAERTFARALAAQPPGSSSFVLNFKAGSTELDPDSQATLDALLAEVARRQAAEVQVTGHTDRVGTAADNDRLSMERAQVVRDLLANMLLQRGLPASFVRAVGRGEREPLVPTEDEQPEPRNRRVEVLVR
jgi:outer membrane protein OmpA-like peptidoglycan-associated protein